MKSMIIVTEDGCLSRQSRNLIENAPAGVCIRVKVSKNYITGYSVNHIIMDDIYEPTI
jgi:hypothetical protein